MFKYRLKRRHHPLSPSKRGPMKCPSRDEILAVLRREKPVLRDKCGVKRIALFGSALRNELTPSSDIDILIDITDPDGLDSLDRKIDILQYLEDILGRTVDVAILSNLKDALRPSIEAEAHYV